MPDLSKIHIDRAMQSLSIAFQNDLDSYLVTRGCGIRRVLQDSDKYYAYNREFGQSRTPAGQSDKAIASLRRPGTEATELDYDLTQESYSCNDYAYRDFVSDKEIAKSDSPLSPLIDSAQMLYSRLRNDQEAIFARLVCNPSRYNASNKTTLANGTTSWSAYSSSSSSPLSNIRTARQTLRKTLGKEPNTMLLSAEAADVLSDHPEIKDVVKFTDGSWLQKSGLPTELRNLRLVVGTAVADTSAEGAAYSGEYLFGNGADDQAVICYVPPGRVIGQKEVSSFILFDALNAGTQTYGISARSYRDEKREGWIVECMMNFDIRYGVKDGSGLITGAYLIDKCTA